MTLTSNYRRETLLSLSFFLDRITPAALYFLPVLIISHLGSSAQISTYSVFSSIFTSFVAIPLGFTTAIRYYSSLAQVDGKNEHSAGSAVALTLGTSIVSIIAYFAFFHFVFQPQGFNDAHLLLLFAVAIFIVAPYYSITSMNEAKKDVSINNLCGFLSIPLFLISTYTLHLKFDIVFSCTLAFVLTRFIMLALIFAGFRDKKDLLNISYLAVHRIAKYGAAIAALFFIQKLVLTATISLLSTDKIEIAAFQLITVYALLVSLASNAIFTNVFIGLAKRDSAIQATSSISLLNLMIVMALVTTFTWWFVSNQIDAYLKDEHLTTFIKSNLNLILCYLISEGLMTVSIIVSRACGDTWRCQSIWFISVLLMFALNRSTIDLPYSLFAFIAADFSCIAMCFYNFRRYLSKTK